MAKMTKAQQEEIKLLTRRANRRLERAPQGQRKALEYYVQKATGATKFSAASKGFTYEQAELKLKTLRKFLEARSTTRKGWDAVKRENVRKANETLSEQGYDLTDEELAEILTQIDSSNRSELYRAVNLVQAAKQEAEEEDLWEGSSKQIAETIGTKATAQEALKKAIQARKERLKLSLGVMKGKNPRKKK